MWSSYTASLLNQEIGVKYGRYRRGKVTAKAAQAGQENGPALGRAGAIGQLTGALRNRPADQTSRSNLRRHFCFIHKPPAARRVPPARGKVSAEPSPG